MCGRSGPDEPADESTDFPGEDPATTRRRCGGKMKRATGAMSREGFERTRLLADLHRGGASWRCSAEHVSHLGHVSRCLPAADLRGRRVALSFAPAVIAADDSEAGRAPTPSAAVRSPRLPTCAMAVAGGRWRPTAACVDGDRMRRPTASFDPRRTSCTDGRGSRGHYDARRRPPIDRNSASSASTAPMSRDWCWWARTRRSGAPRRRLGALQRALGGVVIRTAMSTSWSSHHPASSDEVSFIVTAVRLTAATVT